MLGNDGMGCICEIYIGAAGGSKCSIHAGQRGGRRPTLCRLGQFIQYPAVQSLLTTQAGFT